MRLLVTTLSLTLELNPTANLNNNPDHYHNSIAGAKPWSLASILPKRAFYKANTKILLARDPARAEQQCILAMKIKFNNNLL